MDSQIVSITEIIQNNLLSTKMMLLYLPGNIHLYSALNKDECIPFWSRSLCGRFSLWSFWFVAVLDVYSYIL